MQVSVRSNATEVAAALGKMARDQVPFVSAVTLTRVAQRARSAMQSEVRKRFEIRSKRVPAGIRYRPADKRDWPHRQHSLVGTLDEFLAQHEQGGRKRPGKGARRIAIPVEARIKRTTSGAIRKAQKPRSLVQKGKATEVRGALFGRRGRGRASRLVALYWLRPYVLLKPRLGMRATVQRVAAQEHGPVFKRELSRALAKTEARLRARRPR